jgi:hypothetical protein
MKTEEVKKIIEEALKNMGCTDILFPDLKEGLIVVIFNCKEITSFVTAIPGWTYSGIHLDTSKERQYKIDFQKLSQS